MRPFSSVHRTIRSRNSDSCDSDTATKKLSTITPSFNFDGWFHRSKAPVRNSFDESVGSSTNRYRDDQDTISFVEGDRSANTALSSDFDDIKDSVDTSTVGEISRHATESLVHEASMSQIYDTRDFHQFRQPSSYRSKKHTYQRGSEKEKTINAISTVNTSVSKKQVPWNTLRGPRTIHVSRLCADEVSVVTAPHLSDEAKIARLNRSRSTKNSIIQSQNVESCDGSAEISMTSSSSVISSLDRTYRDRLLFLPKTSKDLLSTEDIHSTKGYEISLVETREEDPESNRSPNFFSLFSWSKKIRDGVPEKAVSSDTSENGSQSSYRGGRSSSRGSRNNRRKGGSDINHSNTISDEHRQDVAARVKRIARAATSRTSPNKNQVANTTSEVSLRTEKEEEINSNLPAPRATIPAVLPIPIRKENPQMASSGSSWLRGFSLESSPVKNSIESLSKSPNVVGRRSEDHEDKGRRPKQDYETQKQMQQERMKNGRMNTKRSNSDICSANSTSQPALSMNSDKSQRSMPKSILKTRSKIDPFLADEPVGSKGQNQLVEIATIPHSFSLLETTDEGVKQRKLNMKGQGISQKKLEMPKQSRIALIFGKGSRKKEKKSSEVHKDAIETNASSEKSSILVTESTSTMPIGNLSIPGNPNSKVASSTDSNVGNRDAPSILGYHLESARSGVPSFLPAPTTGTTSSEPLLTSGSTPVPQTPSLAVSGRELPAARNSLDGNVSFDSKARDQSAKRGDALKEKSMRIKRILGINSKRDHKGGNDLQKMVRKINAAKLKTKKPSNAMKGAYSGSLDQSPTRSIILAESNDDERQLLQKIWPNRRQSKSWNAEDEKKMLKAMNKVVKRRLDAIELLEKEPTVDNSGCFDFNVFGNFSCTG